ncbi:sugar-phosphatase [Edwardsiella tarda]|uniref:sugar-phosphatase n=1 Tax=Edwardsiella tarda TaxID=636 RepID=UPI0002DD6FC3|nr:sugar-phosphatase [Edwardsiella tarda]
MPIKLIAIDLDGTLLNDAREITPAVQEAIAAARRQGVRVVLATGRPLVGVQRYLQELALDTTGEYCLCNNGGLVVHADSGEVLFETSLDYDDYRYLEALAREVGSHFHALDAGRLFTANRDISKYTVHEAFITGIPLYFCPAESMDPTLRFPKMMMIDHPEVLEAAIARIPSSVFQRYTLLRSSPFFLEILHRDVDKGKGIARLAQHLGIERQSVMCIGDHGNDLAMIEYAGLGVAMGNADAAILAAAQYVTASNREDGVAQAIRQWVLNAA